MCKRYRVVTYTLRTQVGEIVAACADDAAQLYASLVEKESDVLSVEIVDVEDVTSIVGVAL